MLKFFYVGTFASVWTYEKVAIILQQKQKEKLMKIVFPKQPKRELKLRKSLSILGIESFMLNIGDMLNLNPLKMGREVSV